MKTTPAKLLDVVALLEDKPASGLAAGQVGTIVEVLAPDVFEVEFCDLAGTTIGFAELCRHEFLVLRHEAALAA
ncbi:MAG: DUF4926 domain-containing protein [Verrucomicrobiota bacterium]